MGIQQTHDQIKRNYSKSTSKSVIDRLEAIRNKMNVKTYRFINNFDKTIKLIEESYKNINSKRLSYYAITVFLKLKKKLSKKDKELLELYEKEHSKYRDLSFDKARDLTITDKQKERMIKYDELQKIAQDNYDKVKKSDFNKRNVRVLNKQLKDYSEAVYLMIYAFSPPTRLESYNAVITEKDCDSNCFIIKDNRVIYKVKDFKNSKSMKQQVIKKSAKVSKVIIDYYDLLKELEINDDGKFYLFSTFGQGQMKKFKSSNSFGQFLKRLFNKYVGKGLTVNDLRHFFTAEIMKESDYSKLTNKEKEFIHKKLLHGQSIGELYDMKEDSGSHEDILKKLGEKYGF